MPHAVKASFASFSQRNLTRPTKKDRFSLGVPFSIARYIRILSLHTYSQGAGSRRKQSPSESRIAMTGLARARNMDSVPSRSRAHRVPSLEGNAHPFRLDPKALLLACTA